MRHHNSVFHDVLKRVPWSVFERLVAEHGADKHVRHLPTKSQLIALLYGQLSGAVSLREVVGGLGSHAARLYHLGARPAARATLADANAKRPAEVFTGLFAALLAQAQPGLRRKLGEAIHLIDATSLRLSGTGSQWARFSANACGAKLHVIYDADAEHPIYAALTPARVNDVTAAKDMPIQPGATYVFDLGYYDYDWWARMHADGCRIVTRFKTSTPLIQARPRLVPEPAPTGAAILEDRVGLLPRRQAKRRLNPFSALVREVRVRIDSGRQLRLLTNDLTAPAEDIAALYKRRWAIELFFRWVKQTLRIRHGMGRSENAVRIQIAVALIAFLLLKMAKDAQTTINSLLAFTRLVRSNLMHLRTIQTLEKPASRSPIDPRQIVFEGLLN